VNNKYIYAHIHIYTHTYIHTYIYIMLMYIHRNIHEGTTIVKIYFVCVYACVCVRMCVCVCVCGKVRQLSWQRKHNTKPRELGIAIQDLSKSIALKWRQADGSRREVLRQVTHV